MKCVGTILAALLVVVPAAKAQMYQPQYGPMTGNTAYTPYVNLLQRNVNPAINYLGIVQPQLQAQATFQQLQNEINRTPPGFIGPPRNTGIADTGYAPARYMQYSQYFGTLSGPRNFSYQTTPGTNAATYGRR
jgi:hypothetical protein